MSERRPFRCFVGFHQWTHATTQSIPESWWHNGPFIFRQIERDVHYRECALCGKLAQYYPKRAALAEQEKK